MKHQSTISPLRVAAFLTCAFLLAILLFTSRAQAASVLRDGTYTIDYTVLKAENDSVSMANDYWEKPATVHVKDGKMQVEVTLNHSAWITEYKAPSGSGFADVEVVKEDPAADTRLVRFPVADLTVPLESKIHVTVESVDYDHDYTIRLSFDEDSLKESESAASSKAEASVDKGNSPSPGSAAAVPEKPASERTGKSAALNNAGDETGDSASETGSGDREIPNPKTGDRTPVLALILLFIVSSVFVFRQVLTAERNKK
ncbi:MULTISPECIES: heme uptake protein IsdC [Paenibacillus]|uniref:Heme uptake protein IsdC n=1 Tax=Paenibacillus macerans TaxID=44252 RepID=A0A090Z797_PAEMA|nr:heme uptake protein IsdC [Paenibacillus macerans]KFN06517.1 heme uptake protein IsdC [Paenibacillus macerans]MBS5909151.1 heme uptake protein IsdC [Paenibacillus macerans]MCY7558166.1 heme uptake protein IsdC [Paenibacillus macerans]MEC0151117.1 heme uptake protein IsdC [Paenibacillus macerans]SUA85692.1 NEAr transporter [Paenibacillus macerans]